MLPTRRHFRLAWSIALSLGAVSCSRLPREQPVPAVVWIVAAPEVPNTNLSYPTTSTSLFSGPLVLLDSTSLSPVLVDPKFLSRRLTEAEGQRSGISVVTTYQGSRYHPEIVRALTDELQVMARAASAIVASVSGIGSGVFLDFQDAAPYDLARMTLFVRTIADSARSRNLSPVAIIVPAGDTVAYPTKILAGVADLIVVRLYGEHRPGTPPGPIVSPQWAMRQLGIRAVDIGTNRLVALIPLFGYIWNRDGTARPITFADAQALVVAEGGSFHRDPATGLLTASGRDGWMLWLPDASFIESLIRTVRKGGVNRFALAAPYGADPAILARLPAMFRR